MDKRLSAVMAHRWFAPGVAFVLTLLAAVLLDPAWLAALPFAPIVGVVVSDTTVRAGEFLAWEATSLKREQVTVASGQNLKAGMVCGRVNKGSGRVSTPTVVGTGNGTVNNVYAGPDVEVGNYVLTLKTVVAHGGVWGLVAPSGRVLPDLTMTPGAGGSTVYTGRHINFTIVDGSTDFALNDAFTFVVSTTAPTVIGTGNGTISSITLGPDARPGNYRLEIIQAIANGGQFKLTDPDGEVVDTGFIVAGAGGTYVGANKRQVNFTLTDGATDFAVGDAFNISVFNQLSGGSVVPWDPTGVDGRDDFAGILLDNVDATLAAKGGVLIVRDSVVVKTALLWGAAITAAQKESAYVEMARVGVIPRDGVLP